MRTINSIVKSETGKCYVCMTVVEKLSGRIRKETFMSIISRMKRPLELRV